MVRRSIDQLGERHVLCRMRLLTEQIKMNLKPVAKLTVPIRGSPVLFVDLCLLTIPLCF